MGANDWISGFKSSIYLPDQGFVITAATANICRGLSAFLKPSMWTSSD